ncbi:MAG: S24 family peptidase [Campylobacteraceae bacterium]|nr:S24 family peptidase [Campylobacteraceae bacterium]
MSEINVDYLKRKYGSKNDEELAKYFDVTVHTIKGWKQRGVPDTVKFYENKNTNVLQDNKNVIRIPKLSVTASCGGGGNLDSIDTFEENGEMLIDSDTLKVTTTNKSLKSIQVSGYSMVPMLFPDSWVVFDDSGEYKGEGLYVLNWDNTLMVKLLQLTPHGQIRIISANKDYESYTVDRNDDNQLIFYIVGKVTRIVM